MSLGIQFLFRIIDTNDPLIFEQRARRDLFFGDLELKTFSYLSEYIRKNNRLPTKAQLKRHIGADVEEIDDHLDDIQERIRQRKLLNDYGPLITRANQLMSEGRTAEALAQLSTCSSVISSQVAVSNLVTFEDMIRELAADIPLRREQEGVMGIPTPWSAITAILRGFQPGDMYGLVARPKMGKTHLLNLCALHAYRLGNDVTYVSMEMGRKHQAVRMGSLFTGIPTNLLSTGRIGTWGEHALHQIQFPQARFNFVEGAFSSTISDIEAVMAQTRPRLGIIDGAYLLKIPEIGNRYATWEKVMAITERLKLMCERLGFPLVATYQLNRQGEGRGRIGTANVQLSDAIGQIVSALIGIYPIDEIANQRRLLVQANRHGGLGSATINFDFDQNNFEQVMFETDERFEHLEQDEDTGMVLWEDE